MCRKHTKHLKSCTRKPGPGSYRAKDAAHRLALVEGRALQLLPRGPGRRRRSEDAKHSKLRSAVSQEADDATFLGREFSFGSLDQGKRRLAAARAVLAREFVRTRIQAEDRLALDRRLAVLQERPA